MVQSAEAFTTYNPKQPSRSDGDPMYRYPSQEYEEPEIPFLPSVPYSPNAGVGPLAVVLGLGAWIEVWIHHLRPLHPPLHTLWRASAGNAASPPLHLLCPLRRKEIST